VFRYLLVLILSALSLLALPGAATARPAWHTDFALASPRTLFGPAYTPAQIRTAYDFTPLYARHVDGTGQTVALLEIDGFHMSDIRAFDKRYGLADPHITVTRMGGSFTLPVQGETTMDIEWLHALAPGAAIRVYDINPRASDAAGWKAMTGAIRRAVAAGAGTVSISLGTCGPDKNSTIFSSELAKAMTAGVSVFVSSGDTGDLPGPVRDCGHKLRVGYPAGDPSVTAVGGTSLDLNADATISSEMAWAGSGGGRAALRRPVWQTVSTLPADGHRWAPDVSFLGDPNTGVAITLKGHVRQAGGTSLGAPAWAATWALIRQAAGLDGVTVPASPLILYRVAGSPADASAFHDITVGTNGRYLAGPGWDAVTGWGTPDVAQLEAAIEATLKAPSAP